MKTEYKVFSICVELNGQIAKTYEFPAVSIEAAMADIQAAVFGQVRLIQWYTR